VTALWGSFLVVALAEMGDKTQLIALTPVSRYRRPGGGDAGHFARYACQSRTRRDSRRVVVGLLPTSLLGWLVRIGFVGFGIWTLMSDRAAEPGRHDWGPVPRAAA
jgi:Ca2+/H+ antiporter, TMEM165/GDT1 family